MNELDWDEDEVTGVWIPHTTLFKLLDAIEKEWGTAKSPEKSGDGLPQVN